MEIGAVFGNFQSYGVQQGPLTSEQKTGLEEIIAKYDPENMTKEDHQALRSELRAASIPRCRETGQILREAGLRPPPPNGSQGPPPEPPPGSASTDNSSLLDLISQYEGNQITQEELFTSLEEYFQAGMTATGNLLDELA